MIQDLICPLLSRFREGLIPHYPCIHRQAHMHICTNGHMPTRAHKETGHIHVHMSTDTQRERQRDTHRDQDREQRQSENRDPGRDGHGEPEFQQDPAT